MTGGVYVETLPGGNPGSTDIVEFDELPPDGVTLAIAGIAVKLERTRPDRPELLRRRYGPFRSEPAAPDLVLRTHPDEEPPPFDGELVFSNVPYWRLWRGPSGARRYEGLGKGGEPFRVLLLDENGREADLYRAFFWWERLADHPHRESVLAALFEDPIDQLLFIDRLAQLRRGVLVHAACVVRGGRAHVFAARSGGGKTTLSRGIRSGRVLTDDRTALVLREGGFVAHGTPWFGQADLKSGGSAPLAGIYFLDKTAAPGLHPISRTVAFRELLFLAFPTYWDRTGLEFAMDTLEAALGAVPIARLGFKPGEDALEQIPLP